MRFSKAVIQLGRTFRTGALGLLTCAVAAEVNLNSTLINSTLLGGSANDAAQSVTCDAQGNSYVTGRTLSRDFPVRNAWQADFFAPGNAFVARFDEHGTLLFATHFGSGREVPEAITLDAKGNILIAGSTSSTDLPATAGAFQEEYAGGSAFGRGDGFIAKFSNDGSELLYCSYLGGSGDDTITSIALDSDGNILLAGSTDSQNLPGATSLGTRGKYDAFVVKLDPAGERMIWSRAIGGRNGEWSVRMRLGSDNAIYFTGWTLSSDLPVTSNARQKLHQLCSGELGFACEELLVSDAFDFWDGFFGIIEPDGSGLRYLSYTGRELFGDASIDSTVVRDLALSSSGEIVLAGEVELSEPAPEPSNGFQEQAGGGTDGFVARLAPPDWKVIWSSYLGGSEDDWAAGVVLGSREDAFIIGQTRSPDFPLKDPLPRRADGSLDGFLTKVSPDGRTITYSTLIGGAEEDVALGIVLNSEALPLIVGATKSADFPHQLSYQTAMPGSTNQEAFIAKIVPAPVRPPLEISRSGSSIIASWPAEAEGFVLERTDDLSSQAWTEVNITPLVLGSKNAAVLSPESEARFFRLKRP